MNWCGGDRYVEEAATATKGDGATRQTDYFILHFSIHEADNEASRVRVIVMFSTQSVAFDSWKYST
jgi:hypothetical protein